MAIPDLLDDDGHRIEGDDSDPKFRTDPQERPPHTPAFNAQEEINKIFGGSGMGAGETDAANLAAKNPEDRARFIADLTAQRDRRAASTNDRRVDSQSPEGNALYGSGTGNTTNTPGGGTTRFGGPTSPRFQNTSPQFDDPASSLYENYALDRFRQRTNPDPNSGTAMFEQYAKELIQTLKGPVYSPQDEAVLKSKAVNTIEQERSATKQRWLEEMSRRGIPPSSGVALDGLQKVEQHFNEARNAFETEFAAMAVGQTRQNRMQVLDTLGTLAGSEEGRLREAGGYAAIPLELQNNAFQRNLQLVGAGGSPASVLNSALQLAQFGQNQNAYNSQQRQQLSAALLQYLGYMFSGDGR